MGALLLRGGACEGWLGVQGPKLQWCAGKVSSRFKGGLAVKPERTERQRINAPVLSGVKVHGILFLPVHLFQGD